MLATTKSATTPNTIDLYLGFEIHQSADDTLVAFPHGWSYREGIRLEAANLPAIRRSIWNWWHRLLD